VRHGFGLTDDSAVMVDESRDAKHEGAFKRYLRGDAEEIRTYSAMTTSGVPIPQGFMAAYVEALKSFSGIRQVANVITTLTGQQLKNPFADDTANIGERLNENDPVSLANPTYSSASFGAFRYSSKGVKYSAQLLQDAGIDLTQYLSKILARRVGRLTNTEYTNGGSGGPAGVIPSLTNVQTTAGATAVTVAEIVSLQSLDEAYLSGSVYMFSPGVERALKSLTASGLPVFPEMRTGKVLCGFPYVLNVDMPSALAANAQAIAFGNFGHAVTIREVVPSLLVSRERFAEQNMLYAAMRHDQDCQVVDASALNVLQQHA
jgi:HK97 family phage major capsid protein